MLINRGSRVLATVCRRTPPWQAAGLREVADDTSPTHERPRDQAEESTYDELKAAAHRTGDAAKEWMSGSSTTGSSVYKAAKEDKEKLYMGTKRAVEGGLGPTSETHGKDGMFGKLQDQAESVENEVKGAASKVVDMIGRGVDAAKQAVASMASLSGPAGATSPRAEWESTRAEQQRAAEQATPKSQVTDEAHGDNPSENTPRKDKQVTPEEFYTRH